MIPNGQNLQITVAPNAADLAILNGLQLLSKEVPENEDSDGDGIPDREELRRGTNPFVADANGNNLPPAPKTLLQIPFQLSSMVQICIAPVWSIPTSSPQPFPASGQF